ncbi:thymidine kinase cytosolic [Biomphalaria glabrata]|uniref:Thymidine kinase n=1 Tax=Biomphalaria glabrata TaxID=6526 RepID=A0A9U8E8J8_BIOGL|nr:thymidine kinase, cytosolic-like [Biomphalaria glabrata]KAI8731516.1 thymidine kinase; cytosolic-like [Biomphalaria glabrata]
MSSQFNPHVHLKNTSSGQIQIIFGPMFSGKTTELMRRMKRYQIANYRCLIIKYAKDIRYDLNGIATHDRQTLAAISAEILSDLQSEALKHDVIGIDEGQFFPDIVQFCDKLANQGKIVIVAALDGTFQKKGFGDILNLVPLAEHVLKLTAVCMNCYNEASFTKRKGSETEVEVIGGSEKYLAVCRQCFTSPNKKRTPLKPVNVNKETLSATTKKLFTNDETMEVENAPLL